MDSAFRIFKVFKDQSRGFWLVANGISSKVELSTGYLEGFCVLQMSCICIQVVVKNKNMVTRPPGKTVWGAVRVIHVKGYMTSR